MKQHNAAHIQIISKIENQEALDNLDWIVKESDWVMVARWDLGVEVEISTLPYYQKVIMDACFTYGKTIIVCYRAFEKYGRMTISYESWGIWCLQ